MNKLNELRPKQFNQLWNIALETQSVLPHEKLTILEIIAITVRYCTCNNSVELLKEKLDEFKIKYYPYGLRQGKRLSPEHIRELYQCYTPRFVCGIEVYKPFRPIELIAFVNALRACRDYIRGNFSDSAFNVFVSKLEQIRIMMS